MNSPVRPSSYFTSGIAPSAPGGILATVPNPPPEVARLPAGTTLRGVVVGEDGRGQALIKTDLGILAVATKAHLPKDSEVVLQLRSSGTHLHIMVMQARSQAQAQAPLPPPLPNAPLPAPAPPGQPSGQPLGQGLDAPVPQGGTYGGTQAAGQPAGPLAHPAVFTDLVTLGQTVRATVHTPAAQAGPAAAGGGAEEVPLALTRLAPGTVLALRILSVSGSQAGPGTAPATPQGAAAPSAAQTGPIPASAIPANPLAQASVGTLGGALAGSAPGSPAPASAPLTPPGTPPGTPLGAPPGTPLGTPLGAPPGTLLRTPLGTPPAAGGVSGAAPGALAGPLTAAAPGPVAAAQVPGPGVLTFGGQVVSVSHAGQPILTTPLGTLILELEARLPAGSLLTLELAPGGLPREAGAAARPSMPGSLGYAWPALEEALSLLSDPAAAAGAAREAFPGLPQPGPRLASGILFFLAALGGGDLGRWLGGQAMQTLRSRGGDTLLGRLARDLTQMGRMAEGTVGGAGNDWRLLPIPLWDGEQLRQLRLYLRQHEKRRDDAKDRARRAATRFILELEMSRLGEMQLDGLVREKRFDLVLRTRGALPEAMRRGIREIFEDANAAAGYAGSLGFQASADWHILPAEAPHEAGGLVV